MFVHLEKRRTYHKADNKLYRFAAIFYENLKREARLDRSDIFTTSQQQKEFFEIEIFYEPNKEFSFISKPTK